MTQGIPNIFKIPDLRKKILFTLAMVAVYRLGVHVPVPGIDPGALRNLLDTMRGTIFNLYDVFVGGALSKASVFGLGIMPYISASIIFQLLGSVFPVLEKLQRDEEGRKKVNQYTRYATVGLAVVQSAAFAVYLESVSRGESANFQIVAQAGMGFRLMTILTLTAGTIFVMWLGEQITDRGIGNGISFLILVGCLDSTPQDLARTFEQAKMNSWLWLLMIVGIVFAVYAGVVAMTMATRKIPV
ncbi:preprotein translocase subunit SecY, partial [candidate division WOR-3 bacterium]|nr:preprotein translocase subunit SecY [candidate division WOR-3 bacterium]